MKVLESEFAKGFIRMADDGWQLRYHERNGGNLSYRIRPEEIEEVREDLVEGDWREIGAVANEVAGEYFMVSVKKRVTNGKNRVIYHASLMISEVWPKHSG